MSSNVTSITPVAAASPATADPASAAAAPGTTSLRAAIVTRLREASTWAGLGGILLVVLNLLPAALPQFHAALTQHGWARMTGLAIALLSFVVAVAKREGNGSVAAIAAAAEVVVETEKTRATVAVV